MSRISLSCTILISLISGLSASAQTAPAQPRHPSQAFTDTFKAEMDRREYVPKLPQESRWFEGGDRYTVLEPSASNKDQTDLVAYDSASGSRAVLVPASRLIPAGAKEPLSIDDYSWSVDNKLMLIFTNSQKVWRLNTRGDYWVLRLSDWKLTQVGKSLPAATLMFAKFSPDSQSVAYVSRNNIYAEELYPKDGTANSVRQLTTDGIPGESGDIINGTTDWVTEEELELRDAFRWSPDSKSIAYWQFDQSGVGEYTLINDEKGTKQGKYPEIFRYKYPQPGGVNSSVRVGVIAATGGATTWIKLAGDPRNHYIPRMDWVPEPDHSTKPQELILQYLNRLQNDNQVYLANPVSGEAKMLFEDKDPAWVDTVDQFEWLKNKAGAQDLFWLSERDGWRHAYLVSRSGGQLHLITDFPADVIEEVSVDEAGGWFYFMASPDNPIQTYLYRARLDGSGKPERVTPKDAAGTHTYQVAPNGKWAMHSWSSVTQPPTYDFVDLVGKKPARVMIENKDLIAKQDALNATPVEFTDTLVHGRSQTETVKLSTSIVKPPNFDLQKKYPMLVYVYSEPASALVKDSWGFTFDKVIAREGYVLVSFDNQGTPAPKGRAWRKSIYGDIGVLSTQQQDEAIVEFAKEHSYIDTTRVGMWGHSGGGSATLNEIFRHPGRLAAGVAIAPMADQTLYDTIYQERYMGLPAENAKGYHDGSPISFADGLADPLLIIHGSGDDNVHFQGTEMLVDKLIAAGKPFEFMDYPNRTHGIYEGQGTLEHRFTLMMRFFEDHVPPGPR